MSAVLETLQRRGFAVHLDGDRLMVRGPRGALTEELRTLIRQHKPEIVEALRHRSLPEARTPITLADLPRIAARLRMDDGRAVYVADLAREFDFPAVRVGHVQIAQGPHAWCEFIAGVQTPELDAIIAAFKARDGREES